MAGQKSYPSFRKYLIVGIIAGVSFALGLISGITQKAHRPQNQVAEAIDPCKHSKKAPQSLQVDFLRVPDTFIPPLGDIEAVRRAAARNQCFGDDWLLLLAIWKAENGGKGREFGIIDKRASGLESQAAWAAATIVKNRERWDGEGTDFIEFLGSRYCPPDAHSLNKNWVPNVRHWFDRLMGLKQSSETGTAWVRASQSSETE